LLLLSDKNGTLDSKIPIEGWGLPWRENCNTLAFLGYAGGIWEMLVLHDGLGDDEIPKIA